MPLGLVIGIHVPAYATTPPRHRATRLAIEIICFESSTRTNGEPAVAAMLIPVPRSWALVR
jgi:hypothetical protein